MKFGGGRIGGGGCVHEGGFRCGVLCWFWAEGAHWCLAGALRFWVALCVFDVGKFVPTFFNKVLGS